MIPRRIDRSTAGPAPAPTPTPISAADRWMGLWWSTSTVSLTAALAAWDSRRLRKLWLTELSKLVDRQLRSPAFLGMTRSWLTALTHTPTFVPPPRHSQEKTHDPGNGTPDRSDNPLLQPGR